MAIQLQLRKGNTLAHSTFTGAAAEVTVDTSKKTVVVHDGSTAGGFPLALKTDVANLNSNISVLTTANIAESGNLYFTNARVVAALTAGQSITIDANGRINSTATGGGAVDSVNGLTGTVTLTTANIAESSNLYFTNARVYSNVVSIGYATVSHVSNEIANLVNSAPATLDTLNELANALGNDASFSTSIINSLATKANTASLTTANVTELTNLYFTNTRAINAFTEGTGINIDSNGLISSTVTGDVVSVNGLTGTVTLTTANIAESGNLYFTNARAINAFTEGAGINIDANGLITSTATGTGTVSNSFTTISVTGQSSLYANGESTLTIAAAGLLDVTTNNVTNTVTIGSTNKVFPFYDNTNVYKSIQLRISDTILNQSLANVYLPFTKSDGSSVTTLRIN